MLEGRQVHKLSMLNGCVGVKTFTFADILTGVFLLGCFQTLQLVIAAASGCGAVAVTRLVPKQ